MGEEVGNAGESLECHNKELDSIMLHKQRH